MAIAFGVVTVVYIGLAAATIAITSDTGSRVPLADLVAVGFGRAGRDATAVLAVALTMGTMNVYMGGAAKLAAALAEDGSLPRWLGAETGRSVPRRPLVVIALVGGAVLGALIAGLGSTDGLVRATSACFVAVYLLALASAVRFLDGPVRVAAAFACVCTVAIAVFSSAYLLVPLAGALATLTLRHGSHRQRSAVRKVLTEELPPAPECPGRIEPIDPGGT
jgi:amino acid efflux transporter